MLLKMIPHKCVSTIYDIDLDELRKQGVKAIITDLDNTLVGAKVPFATPELAEWLKSAREKGFQVLIVSNNNKSRVSRFADPLHVPFIFKARKPTKGAFQKALQLLDVRAKEAVVIGDQLLTDIFGGNRAGIYTILVRPINLREDGLFTRLNRSIERWVFSRLKKKGFLPWEDSHEPS